MVVGIGCWMFASKRCKLQNDDRCDVVCKIRLVLWCRAMWKYCFWAFLVCFIQVNVLALQEDVPWLMLWYLFFVQGNADIFHRWCLVNCTSFRRVLTLWKIRHALPAQDLCRCMYFFNTKDQIWREDTHPTYSPAVSFIPDGYMDRFSSSEGSAKAGGNPWIWKCFTMGKIFLSKRFATSIFFPKHHAFVRSTDVDIFFHRFCWV